MEVGRNIKNVAVNKILRAEPNLYMAAEVKRKNYPLRIGFYFSLFPSFAIARIDLAAVHGPLTFAFYSERQTDNTCRYCSQHAVCTKHLSGLTELPKRLFDNQRAALGRLQNIFRVPYPGEVN